MHKKRVLPERREGEEREGGQRIKVIRIIDVYWRVEADKYNYFTGLQERG